ARRARRRARRVAGRTRARARRARARARARGGRPERRGHLQGPAEGAAQPGLRRLGRGRQVMRARSLAVFAPLLAAACSALEARPPPAVATGRRSAAPASALGAHVRVEPDGSAAWIDYELAAGAWSADDTPGWWSAPRPDGTGFQKTAEELELAAGET